MTLTVAEQLSSRSCRKRLPKLLSQTAAQAPKPGLMNRWPQTAAWKQRM